MKRYLLAILVAVMLTGCSAESGNVLSETTTYTETVSVMQETTFSETAPSEVEIITETEATTVAETTTIIEMTTTAETEQTTVYEEPQDKYTCFRFYNENNVDGIYVAGSRESLDFYTYVFGGDRLAEWGKDIDFEKDAVVMNVIKDRSSSYSFEVNSIYVTDNQIVFDYSSYCPEICNEDIVSYVIAGTIAKSELDFLENDDEWGIELDASYNPDEHCVYISFLQWGENDTRELLSGSWYELERYDEENGWCKVDYSSRFDDVEIGWTDEGWIIAEYGQTPYAQNLALYDELQTGRYRISKSVINLRRAGVYDEKIYYAEFEVK